MMKNLTFSRNPTLYKCYALSFGKVKDFDSAQVLSLMLMTGRAYAVLL